MQGDWIKPEESLFPEQVFAILNYDEILCTQRVDDDKTELHNAICCEPIPITEAMLLDNGFKAHPNVVEDCMEYVYIKELGGKEGAFIRVFVTPLGKDYYTVEHHGIGNIDLTIQHVHELQHVLRLIGLTDLADNFKIA